MNCSDAGIAFIKRHEGVRYSAYRDSVGVWTIGVGHTGPDVHEGLVIDDDEVDRLLRNDLAIAETCVEDHVHQPLNQNQFDALVSFVFNLGCRNFATSTLLNLINGGDLEAAAGQFMRWNKAGGRILAGLTQRRRDESELFLA